MWQTFEALFRAASLRCMCRAASLWCMYVSRSHLSRRAITTSPACSPTSPLISLASPRHLLGLADSNMNVRLQYQFPYINSCATCLASPTDSRVCETLHYINSCATCLASPTDSRVCETLHYINSCATCLASPTDTSCRNAHRILQRERERERERERDHGVTATSPAASCRKSRGGGREGHDIYVCAARVHTQMYTHAHGHKHR